MPKIIDHDKRRHDIAVAACKAINRHGLDAVKLTQIAREAGSTTGMLAHYFETKWDVVLAALSLMHDRLESRLTKRMTAGRADLVSILGDTLPLDEERRGEAAAWLTFWGAALKNPEMLELTDKIYTDWRAIVRRTVDQCHPGAKSWSTGTREEVISSLILFMDGLTVKALTRADRYPPRALQKHLKNHWGRLLSWADDKSTA